MRTVEIRVDVEGIAGLAEPLRTAATVHLPDVCPSVGPVVFAFPGGGYSRHYYDLSIDDDSSYSQARHHTDRGMVLVACDHLCTGEATTPADPMAVTLEQLAEANAITAGVVADKLTTGTLDADLPPISISASVGIGQSMGGCILTVHQGLRETFDAVGFLGWSGRHTAFPDPSGGTLAITVPRRGDDLHLATMPTLFTPEQFRYCFHFDDVPPEVVDLDLGVGVGVGESPAWRSAGAPPCAMTMLSPGVVAPEAGAITVPVLVASGQRDVVPDPHAEPAAYPSSPDVTVVVVPEMAHMHNFAGTRQYGGQGLSRQHQAAFTQESAPYEMPVLLNIPSLSILAPTLLDFGTEDQKLRHIPAILSAEEVWVQFLSEPSGGSDLAGLVTRATRDGDVFVLNGSKIWSSGAFRSDYALCLARTDWHATKHRGLTCFIVKIHQPGIELQQIKMVNGWNEFCQEFFDDVAIPAENVVGRVNDGWTVASRLLFHERDAVGGGSPYVSGSGGAGDHTANRDELVELARATATTNDHRVRQLVAEARVNDRVGAHLIARVTAGMRTGQFSGPAGSLPRLYAATNAERHFDIALEIAGSRAGAWEEGDVAGEKGVEFLFRQGGSLGGGSNEMQRNIISERVLGMPREYAADKDKPFDEVRHNSSPTRPE